MNFCGNSSLGSNGGSHKHSDLVGLDNFEYYGLVEASNGISAVKHFQISERSEIAMF